MIGVSKVRTSGAAEGDVGDDPMIAAQGLECQVMRFSLLIYAQSCGSFSHNSLGILLFLCLRVN